MNVRTIVAAGAVLATVGAATAPAAGLAAGAPTKTLTYAVSVKKGKLVNGQTSVRARVVVTSPQNDVQDWWSRAAVSSVEYRKAEMNEETSKDAFERTRRLERAMKRATASNRDVVSAVADLLDREGPKAGEKLDLPALAAVPPIDAGP